MSQGSVNLQYTAINVATSGNQTIIPVQKIAGVVTAIKIWGLFLTATAAITVQPFDGTGAMSGTWALLGNTSGPAILPIGEMPWWVLADGNAFILNLGSSSQVSGTVVWSL